MHINLKCMKHLIDLITYYVRSFRIFWLRITVRYDIDQVKNLPNSQYFVDSYDIYHQSVHFPLHKNASQNFAFNILGLGSTICFFSSTNLSIPQKIKKIFFSKPEMIGTSQNK